MITFRLGDASGDAPGAPPGAVAHSYYDGPHGPVFAAYTNNDQVTQAWGPLVPDARFDFGPSGRLDGQRHTSFVDPVALGVGELSGNAVQPNWALFNRRRRGIKIDLGPRLYLYRIAGISSPLLERDDRTPVVSFGGVRAPHQVAEEADDVDVALALVMFYGVPDSAIRAQA